MNDISIVDTDILIDVGRGVNNAIVYLENLKENSILAISVITQLELIVGCQNKSELRATENFLSQFEIINLNENISKTAVNLLQEYRLSHGLLIADGLIAATAISLNIALASKNQKDYRFIQNLNLLSYS